MNEVFCTEEQADAIAEVCKRYDEPPTLIYSDTLCNFIALVYPRIFIGIEPDGYTHS